jgi:hypothetical protein
MAEGLLLLRSSPYVLMAILSHPTNPAKLYRISSAQGNFIDKKKPVVTISGTTTGKADKSFATKSGQFICC